VRLLSIQPSSSILRLHSRSEVVNAILYIYILYIYITHTRVRNGPAYYASKEPAGCERVHLERVTPFIVFPARLRALHGSMDPHQTLGVVFGARSSGRLLPRTVGGLRVTIGMTRSLTLCAGPRG
jgi:hypothetical protein